MLPWVHKLAKGLPRYGWSPVARQIWIAIDDSGDERLAGVTIEGLVRQFRVADDGSFSKLLVELAWPIAYCGHYRGAEINWLVTESCLAWRRTSLLPLAWCAVRLIDAPSFADSTYDRTIGIGRLSLRRSWLKNGPLAESVEASLPTLAGGSLDERLAVHVREIAAAARRMTALLDRSPDVYQLADIAMVARQTLALATSVMPRLPAPCVDSSRDPVLNPVLEEFKRELQNLKGLRGREYDQRLARADSLVRPYALAFLKEICRLDEILAC